MIQQVLVLGSGTAGLHAAVAMKRKLPGVAVRVVRSVEIGTIGVGEGTTPNFPKFSFEYLGLSHRSFYDLAQPTWKIGVRFLWDHATALTTRSACRWTPDGPTCPGRTVTTARKTLPPPISRQR